MNALPSGISAPIDAVQSLADRSARQKQLRAAATQLVSQTFFGPMLKQMRNSPWKSEMFSGGKAGEAYQSMFDAHLAENMGRGVGGKLVDSIVQRWSGQMESLARQTSPAAAQKSPAPRDVQQELKKNATPPIRHDAIAITA